MSDDGRFTIALDAPSTRVDIGQLRRVFQGPSRVTLGPATRVAVEAANAVVREVVREGRIVYGINTGFGQLARTVIAPDHLAELQTNLLRSHSAGVGPRLATDVVRLIVLLQILGLARGHSGVRPTIIDALATLLEREMYPVVPSQGSVGASGDLAPLAHLSSVLIGEGELEHDGRTLTARDGLALAGLEPLALEPKEGLALVNGTQVSTALALAGLFAAEDLLSAAVMAGAMSVEAIAGSHVPFDERIHAIRGQRGQQILAGAYRRILRGSQIVASHVDCGRVQDPYCMRCQPQVMGACLDVMRSAAGVLEIEANAVTDNPLVFPDSGDILSGGNFHGEPVAMAADMLALAIAEIGALSERRIALLVDSHMSGLPPFLTEHSGINSGFMIAQVTAASLASENKSLAHPASVDSLPTSANQEDHVSMATFAGRRLQQMADNTAGIVAIELLAAAQGVEFRRPLSSSPEVQETLAAIRAVVPRFERDRPFAPEIATVTRLVRKHRFRQRLPEALVSTSDA